MPSSSARAPREQSTSATASREPAAVQDQQLAHLSAILQHSYDAIFTTDLEDRITSWNPAAERIYRYRQEQVLGKPATLLLPCDRKDERAKAIATIMSGGQPQPYETKRVRQDGSLIDLYLTISPLRDGEGNLIGVSTISRDISERRAAQNALERKQRELEDFFENAVVGLHWVGPDGKIIWANKAEMDSLGYTAEEYIGHHISEFHADEDIIGDIMQRLGRNEKLHGYEACLRCKDGTIKHVLISSSVLWDESGRFVHTRCFTVDVTARKLAEEALRRTEKMAATGRLAASIAHEINNPLAAVMNVLYLAQTQATKPEVRKYLQMADGELKRVAHIARRTLGFFKDGSEKKCIQLDALVSDVVGIYHSRIEAKRIELQLELSPATVVGYEGELRQVISNLLLNAIEASPAGGIARVRVRSQSSRVTCVVADCGAGIVAADRAKIFEPFFTTKKDTGTGLGLWVSQGIVRSHGGQIRFRSVTGAQRSGTVFRVVIPAF